MDQKIRLENVQKKYSRNQKHSVTALADVSLTISKGEFTAIMGRSGSGKSTLMYIMSGLMKPTQGKVLIEGNDLSEFNEKQITCFRNKKMGFVFQSFHTENAYTALENVMLPLLATKMKKSERIARAVNVLEQVGLADRSKHRPSELSGGELQRVSIARALVNDPQIIFADEPTGNLDSANGRQIIDLLKSITQSGKNVILVTHNKSDAELTDRRIELKDGKILYDDLGDTHDIIY